MQKFIPFLLLCFVINRGIAQSLPADSVFREQARSAVVTQYNKVMNQQSAIYNGNEYIQHDFRIKVHPYFQVDSLQKGSVTYYSVDYNDIPMGYDIVRDELFIRHLDGGYRMRLNSEKVDRFTINGHQFVRLTGDSLVGVRTGFYDLLYSGRTQLLSRRVKVVLEDISTGVYKAEYLSKDEYWIRRDQRYFPVKTLGGALSVYGDKKKELRKLLRAERIKFKENKEKTLVLLAREYDALTR
ncbi:hypothetical protein [Arsenicibacter rosenii]|uniref:Uncharacterized protein n=1 Tax=Arsenicibacter rosenii TaxID=1750698 RepID=A0A1S2VH76_9BACT|nr:hypothetical protein [Arsenicibacter rosenii]OIN57546.1 hypothetical protein BLX24_18830 [Arsenicibacter rosenii]